MWVPGNPGRYRFVEEYVQGSRWAGLGVFLDGNLTFIWGYDNNNHTESDDVLVIDHSLGALCDYVYGKAHSWFYNWLGWHWDYWTDWAEISI